jgi:hypothetical protein
MLKMESTPTNTSIVLSYTYTVHCKKIEVPALENGAARHRKSIILSSACTDRVRSAHLSCTQQGVSEGEGPSDAEGEGEGDVERHSGAEAEAKA